jgi:hypothetical protein
MQTNMIPVDNHSSYFRTCLNDRTDTDQKVSLSNFKRIAGITKTHTSTELCMDYFFLLFNVCHYLWQAQTGVHSVARPGSRVYRLDYWQSATFLYEIVFMNLDIGWHHN